MRASFWNAFPDMNDCKTINFSQSNACGKIHWKDDYPNVILLHFRWLRYQLASFPLLTLLFNLRKLTLIIVTMYFNKQQNWSMPHSLIIVCLGKICHCVFEENLKWSKEKLISKIFNLTMRGHLFAAWSKKYFCLDLFDFEWIKLRLTVFETIW